MRHLETGRQCNLLSVSIGLDRGANEANKERECCTAREVAWKPARCKAEVAISISSV
jgi:hypothetical protein